MIRPWYRSRLFWLGLPGLVFLLWVWRDSGAYSSYCQAYRPGRDAELIVDVSKGLIMLQIPAYLPENLSPRGWEASFFRSPLTADEFHLAQRHRKPQFDLRVAFLWEKSQWGDPLEPDLRCIVMWIGWWLVVLAYTVPWLAMLTLWQRRKARLSRRAAALAIAES
jgi:hypothetical protein